MYPVQCLRQKDRVNVKDRYAAANVAVDALLTRRGIAVGDLGARMMRADGHVLGTQTRQLTIAANLNAEGPRQAFLHGSQLLVVPCGRLYHAAYGCCEYGAASIRTRCHQSLPNPSHSTHLDACVRRHEACQLHVGGIINRGCLETRFSGSSSSRPVTEGRTPSSRGVRRGGA